MQNEKLHNFLKDVISNMPADWVNLTTHRLDIYIENLAKSQFLDQLEGLFQNGKVDASSLQNLPTAFDYIRLGHPLSCVLEWAIGKMNHQESANVISFDSTTVPLLAVLRKNHLENRSTTIYHQGNLPENFDVETIQKVYGFAFNTVEVSNPEEVKPSQDTAIYLSEQEDICSIQLNKNINFYISTRDGLGSLLVANGPSNADFVADIQHVRRRETIAMTPSNCEWVLRQLTSLSNDAIKITKQEDREAVRQSIATITGADAKSVVGSSGLSIQYAIGMGLVHYAKATYPNKAIRFVVPPNCYGGTNDQARRVAACDPSIEVVDMPVDGGKNMVQSIDTVLTQIAREDAVPFIIAEIPTNPRVEVPDLSALKEALNKTRQTPDGNTAVSPVFILDQTFCPNVHFLREKDILSDVETISYVSGSKFPSGGKCTAGYCTANQKAAKYMDFIERHLTLCDNEATALQYEILAQQMPSMNQRIADAYQNTRKFVRFIEEKLPSAKINFVSEELAQAGFTPSVFSLDLPTIGANDEEKEHYKRALNLKLINMMINEIPNESKFCVSYGQLKGCYWTIPATSTQGTTKEGDKDYIVRVALSGNMDLAKHQAVFMDFLQLMKSENPDLAIN